MPAPAKPWFTDTANLVKLKEGAATLSPDWEMSQAQSPTKRRDGGKVFVRGLQKMASGETPQGAEEERTALPRGGPGQEEMGFRASITLGIWLRQRGGLALPKRHPKAGPDTSLCLQQLWVAHISPGDWALHLCR
jgi:hypothetical protein